MEKYRCTYCGENIVDTDEKCPRCGANNPNYQRTAYQVPKTIEELKEWYNSLGLPDTSITKIFIDINYQNPKAFGIYKENNCYIVYMNDDKGNRIIRYDGADESYAVSELYLKIKEILRAVNRK